MSSVLRRSPRALKDFLARNGYHGALTSTWTRYLQEQTGISGSVEDLERHFLRTRGGLGSSLSELWGSILGTQSFTASDDGLRQFLSTGSFPIDSDSFTEGLTNITSGKTDSGRSWTSSSLSGANAIITTGGTITPFNNTTSVVAAYANLSVTPVDITVSGLTGSTSATTSYGVMSLFANASNYMLAYMQGNGTLKLDVRTAGSTTTRASQASLTAGDTTNRSIRLLVNSAAISVFYNDVAVAVLTYTLSAGEQTALLSSTTHGVVLGKTADETSPSITNWIVRKV